MKNRKNYLKARKKQFKWKLMGWHSSSICPKCGQQTIFQIDEYDSWCCITCNEWLDTTCGDPNCPFCSQRPQTPYEAYYFMEMEVGSAGYRKDWRRRNYQHKTDGMRKHKRKREFAENSIFINK